MVKILIGTLLALTAANTMAGNMYIYKDKGGQVLLANVNPSGNFDKFTKKVKVTYYKDSQDYDGNKSNKKQANSKEQNASHGSSSNSNSSSYSNSAYLALR